MISLSITYIEGFHHFLIFIKMVKYISTTTGVFLKLSDSRGDDTFYENTGISENADFVLTLAKFSL